MKVTHASPQLCREDVDERRRHGWSDAAISDAIQVIGYFNYINRVVDAVGIDDEPEWSEPTDPADRTLGPRSARGVRERADS